MKVAVIGSRNVPYFDLAKYLPKRVSEIVSGGARGVDTIARNYAIRNNIKLVEFLPEYDKYGKGAPIVRNDLIIKYADIVVAFWDGESRGTSYVINKCEKLGKPSVVYRIDEL